MQIFSPNKQISQHEQEQVHHHYYFSATTNLGILCSALNQSIEGEHLGVSGVESVDCVMVCPQLGGAVCGDQAADDGVTAVINASASTAKCHPKRFSMLNPSGVLSETDIYQRR